MDSNVNMSVCMSAMWWLNMSAILISQSQQKHKQQSGSDKQGRSKVLRKHTDPDGGGRGGAGWRQAGEAVPEPQKVTRSIVWSEEDPAHCWATGQKLNY